MNSKPFNLPKPFKNNNIKEHYVSEKESVYFEGNFDLYSEEQKVDQLFNSELDENPLNQDGNEIDENYETARHSDVYNS